MIVKQQTVVKKAQGGDVEAFLALTEPVERKVYAVVFALTHSEVEAAQVAADSIVALFGRFPTYSGRGNVETWMTRTAVSEALKLLRERRAVKAS